MNSPSVLKFNISKITGKVSIECHQFKAIECDRYTKPYTSRLGNQLLPQPKGASGPLQELNEVLMAAKSPDDWLIIYLREPIRADHLDGPISSLEVNLHTISMTCPCNGIKLSTRHSNVLGYALLDKKLGPHQGYNVSELIDRLTCSEYLEVKTNFICKKSLFDALESIYGKGHVECHEESVQLRGYHNDLRKETAEIVVRRQYVGSQSNDLGFKLQPDGTYTMIRSEYDKRTHFSDNKLHELEAAYALKSIENTAAELRQSCEIIEETPQLVKVKVYV